MIVDHNTSSPIDLDACFSEAKAVGVRHPPDRDEHDVGFDRLGLSTP